MVDNSKLICLVEGNREIDFVINILRKEFTQLGKYSVVEAYKYKNVKKDENIKYINIMLSIGWDILCFADINSSRCVRTRKSKLIREDTGVVPKNRIVVIRKEIESWYLAGLDEHCCRKLGIVNLGMTDTINKDKCHQLIAKSKYRPREACMQEILKNFNMISGKEKNKTFSHFCQKHLN